MKTIKFYAMITAFAFLSASCVENSEKYKTAVAQRDSIAIEKQALDSNYNRTLSILDDIETGFSEISYSQSQMRINLKGAEGKTTNKKELIAAQMTSIKETIEKNKAKIDELRQLVSKNAKANNKLVETIKRLQSEMDEKSVQIQTLQTELDQKNIKIDELNTTVNNQSENIAEKQSMLEQQTTKMNTVWYYVATSKELKDAKIISTSGLFQSKTALDNELDKNVFTQVDLRTVTSIPTGSKSIKIISSHPQSSYTLVTGDDKKITIEITNSAKFWSISKYLVVQI
ncbi:MAG: hypothetical protein GZ091_01330 [Paludibacter sp.]|nr:hypothetical protein [Paludibacter sp.]